MKTRFLRSWKLVMTLVGVALTGGILSGPGYIADAEETALADVPDAASASQPASQPTAPAPPDVKLSPGASEIAKLAQAGLGEDVMLAYVGNVNSGFSLGSDQIVYLNDLGVSGTVVKAMIQRDAELTANAQAWAAANQPPVTPNTPAPTPPPVPSDDGAYPSPPGDNSGAVNPGDMANDANPVDYPATDDTDYFYNSLAPYGNWIYVSGAGLCWQPTVCMGNHDWQPYFDRGRWIHTDCGWYWQSDYSWGWAAFHYGRWFDDGHRGWVWKPDHVWGPAWVSWRRSEDYCGWAPLPPSAHFVPGSGFQFRGHSVPANFDFGLRANHYTFIPIGRMTDYSPYRYAVSSSKQADLYSQSTAINHITFEHNRVVSHGIDPQQVALASGIQVRTAEIHETPRSPNTTVLSDHMAKQGDSLMIFRPQLIPPSATATPRQFFAPPARGPGAPKTSMNISTPNLTGSPSILATTPAPVQRFTTPLPNMNLASTASVAPAAKTEFYPPGSLVMIGERHGGNSQPSTPARLPNVNFAYAAAQPRATHELLQYNNNQAGYTARTEAPAVPAFGGYRQVSSDYQDRAATRSSEAVIPARYSASSRVSEHSAYMVHGSTPSEPVGEMVTAHHFASIEAHETHVEHFAEHSAPAAVSHSSSPSSSSSGSGHR